MKTLLTFMVCLSISTFSAMATNEADAKFKSCLSGSKLTTADMNNCANHALDDWDKELNYVYRELMNKLNPKAKEAFKHSQRQWLKYRDKEFEFISSMYHDQRFMGSMYFNMRASHRLSVVKDRVIELNRYLRLFN